MSFTSCFEDSVVKKYHGDDLLQTKSYQNAHKA